MAKSIHTQKLHIKKARARHLYHLADGEDVLGTLLLHNYHASSAKAMLGDKSWTLKRAKILRREVHIHESEGKTPTAVFASDWRCKGVLSLNGRPYYWGPANKLWTKWAWRDAEGKEIIRIKTKPNFSEMEGEVQGDSQLTAKENKYLTLVGWYMLLLHHQDPEALIFTGIESSFKKLKQFISR